MVTIRTVRGTKSGAIIEHTEEVPKEKYKTLQELVGKKASEISREKLKKELLRKPEQTKVGKHVGGKIRKITKGMLARMKEAARQQAIYQKQLAQQQAIEVNRLAAEQRAMYEQPADFSRDEQPQQEQIIEDDYERRKIKFGRPYGGGVWEAFRKWGAGQRMRGESGMSQSGQEMPNLLKPQGSPLVREPVNLLTPMGVESGRKPRKILQPVSGHEIPRRIKVW